MKKLYILTAASAIMLANAQTKKSFTQPRKNETPKPFVSHLKESTIKFEQTPDFGNGIISMVNMNNQIFAADDFQLSADTKIESFVFYGSQGYGDLDEFFLGAKMYIFNDINGKPDGTPTNSGNAVAVIDIDENNSGITLTASDIEYTITVDVTKASGQDLNLNANKKYWIAFAPKVSLYDEYGEDPDETFFWALGEGNYAQPMLIDEADLFEAGATVWTPIPTLIDGPFAGMAFTITGENALGTGEVYSNLKKVSVFPNPVVDVIHLKTNTNTAITKTEIFDMSGKLILTSSQTSINVEKLPKAVYIIKAYSGDEVIETVKIIKK